VSFVQEIVGAEGDNSFLIRIWAFTGKEFF